MNTINNLETFISICNTTLKNAELDVIPWQDGMKEDLWRKKSFLSNNRMLTGEKFWYNNRKIAFENYEQTLINLRDEFIINDNQKVIPYTQNKLKDFIRVIEEFQTKHKMGHVKVMPKNKWFFELKDWVLSIQKDISEMNSTGKPASDFFQIKDTEGNCILLTPENWEEHKETFIEKREDSHQAHNLKRSHFARLETDEVKDLITKSTSEKLLKFEYSDFLSNERENKFVIPKFKNNFNNLPESKIFKYFKLHLLDKEIITIEDLNKFLIAAFENKTISNKIVLDDKGKKATVREIFSNFQDISTTVHGSKPKYVRLLSDYFAGYNFTTTSTNWSSGK